MSTKHYFPSTAANTLVPRALRALVAANPHLALSEADRAVAHVNHDAATASIIGGGGSGHEPAWSGFVSEGLLAAEGLAENVVVLPLTDDVSIGRSKSNRVGRRGMPGHVFSELRLLPTCHETETIANQHLCRPC